MTSTKRVIITGGTGLIGRALVAELAPDYEVIVLSRNPAKHAGTFPAGVQIEEWDAQSAAGWGHLTEGAAAVVNLAGESIGGDRFPPPRWTDERKHRILESRLNAGRAVLEAIESSRDKPGVLIQMSAVGYYGPRGDEPLDESAAKGSGFVSDVAAAWEKSIANVSIRTAIIRTGVVFSMEGGAFLSLILPFRLFVGGPLGSGEQVISWIHIRDVVRAIRWLIETPGSRGVYNLTAPGPVPNHALASIIGQVMKRPAFITVPAFALKLALGEVASVVLEGQYVVPRRLQAEGFEFEYPRVEAAVRDLLST
ncbi:MAG: TIGR01777 family oxidoreductase [Anaerolineae bacterium]|nr:TIGR01777 family oxidoreductase [Anaerolineae bacterium]